MSTITNITENIKPYEDETILNLTLRPETLIMRNQLRILMENRLSNENSRLPSYPAAELRDRTVPFLDRDTILEINNTTSSENREEFMKNIINYENSSENSDLLILKSTEQVRAYLNDLLIRASENESITEENIYRIGNIFFYTLSNISGIENMEDVLESLRESMYSYNTNVNRVSSILSTQIPEYNQQLLEMDSSSKVEIHENTEGFNQIVRHIGLNTEQQIVGNTVEANRFIDETCLATEAELKERADEFKRQVQERISANRKRMILLGGGVLASMALTAVGMPSLGLGSVAARSLYSVAEQLSVYTPTVEETPRLRDIFDDVLKKMHKFLK